MAASWAFIDKGFRFPTLPRFQGAYRNHRLGIGYTGATSGHVDMAPLNVGHGVYSFSLRIDRCLPCNFLS